MMLGHQRHRQGPGLNPTGGTDADAVFGGRVGLTTRTRSSCETVGASCSTDASATSTCGAAVEEHLSPLSSMTTPATPTTQCADATATTSEGVA